MKWDDIDSDMQEALIQWLNRTKPTAKEKRMLATMLAEKRFWAWDCILCGDSCVHADPTQEEWPHFQGANDDVDWCFFGNRDVYTEAALWSMCNNCRCHKCGDIPDGSPGWDVTELAERPD